MVAADDGLHIFVLGIRKRIGPADGRELAFQESLIRAEYDRCHADDTFEDLKRRAQFSKDDKGVLRDWMAVAAQRAAEERREFAAHSARRAAA